MPKCEVPSTAMGDIAFNLLIFFVILARAVDDSHVKWRPAVSSNIQTAGHAMLRIAVDKDRKIFLNGQEVGAASITADKLSAMLANAPQGSRKVFLKVDRETPAAQFEPIIEAASAAGAELVHVLNEEKR